MLDDVKLRNLLFKLQGEVSVIHIDKGIVMREDDHTDLVYCMYAYIVLRKKKKTLDDIRHLLEGRFPGISLRKVEDIRYFIKDLSLRAVFPWRTYEIITKPDGKGGAGLTFTAERLALLESEYDGHFIQQVSSLQCGFSPRLPGDAVEKRRREGSLLVEERRFQAFQLQSPHSSCEFHKLFSLFQTNDDDNSLQAASESHRHPPARLC